MRRQALDTVGNMIAVNNTVTFDLIHWEGLQVVTCDHDLTDPCSLAQNFNLAAAYHHVSYST